MGKYMCSHLSLDICIKKKNVNKKKLTSVTQLSISNVLQHFKISLQLGKKKLINNN